jgi:radical SAM protein with 4Fe4S-binding SPASM domain
MGLSQQDDTEKIGGGWQEYCENRKLREIKKRHNLYRHLFKTENLFPSFFQIQTTTGCNGRCIMCPYTYKNDNKIQYMSDELFEKIIREIAEGQKLTKERVKVNLILQNEPFLDKNLIKRIKFIKRFDNLFATTLTNGSLLNEEKIRELEKSGIDWLTVSMDSVNKKTFEKIRPGLDFDRIMHNIELLRNSSLKNKLSLKMILQKENQEERKNFFQFWDKKNVKTELYRVTNRCGTLKVFDDLRVNDTKLIGGFEEFSEEFNTIKIRDGQGFRPARICFFHFYAFNILSNGDVINCCHDWGHENIAGNVQKDTIKAVWQSKFKEYRQLFLKGRGHEIPTCGKCSLHNGC